MKYDVTVPPWQYDDGADDAYEQYLDYCDAAAQEFLLKQEFVDSVLEPLNNKKEENLDGR